MRCSECGSLLPGGRAVEVDWEGHGLRVAGRSHHMDNQEFKMFALLHRRMGRLVAWESLVEALWGPNQMPEGDVMNNHLKVYLSRIRKKLRGGNLEIETVWGEGLRMTERQAA